MSVEREKTERGIAVMQANPTVSTFMITSVKCDVYLEPGARFPDMVDTSSRVLDDPQQKLILVTDCGSMCFTRQTKEVLRSSAALLLVESDWRQRWSPGLW